MRASREMTILLQLNFDEAKPEEKHRMDDFCHSEWFSWAKSVMNVTGQILRDVHCIRG